MSKETTETTETTETKDPFTEIETIDMTNVD